MSHSKFWETMHFIRFDMRTIRSQLITDKFTLASEVWNQFIENCIQHRTQKLINNLFQTRARCHCVQYIANKPDKFGIKLCPVTDVKSKYLPNGFPYLGKDEQRTADKLQS